MVLIVIFGNTYALAMLREPSKITRCLLKDHFYGYFNALGNSFGDLLICRSLKNEYYIIFVMTFLMFSFNCSKLKKGIICQKNESFLS